MAIKHSTIHNPNEIVPSADWNANHTIENNTITNAQLAGSITDNKLNQITTANKVAASAVEDKFLRNDADDSMNNNKITGLKDPTLDQDAATKKYVDDSIPPPDVGIVPIGGVVAWLKDYTNTPALPAQFVECNGQVLSDAESVYNGQTIPDLNGDDRFLRGAAASGAVGGAATHSHNLQTGSWVPGYYGAYAGHIQATTTASSLPPCYDVVWIMRIK